MSGVVKEYFVGYPFTTLLHTSKLLNTLTHKMLVQNSKYSKKVLLL